MTDKTLKIVSKKLNSVFKVKYLSILEDEKLFEELVSYIEEEDSKGLVLKYQVLVINKLLVEPTKFFEKINYTGGYVSLAQASFVKQMYQQIIKLYPTYDLDTIVNINNYVAEQNRADKFIADLANSIDESMETKLKEATLKQTAPVNSKQKVEVLSKLLRKNIIGQEEAINSVLEGMKLQIAGLSTHLSFLFVGRTGTGKTELSRVLGTYVGNYFKINCAEYSEGHEKATLLGSPPGYVGSNEESLLKLKADQSNKWVLVFDEIEKANDKFFNFLLALLEEGKVQDSKGNVLDFTKSIFIMTSNLGVKDIKSGKNIGFLQDKIDPKHQKDVIEQAIKVRFNPEFINRFDETVYFNTLTKEDVAKIVKMDLWNYPVNPKKSLIDFIVEKAYSDEYGARNIKRFIKKNVAVKVADAIIEGKVPDKGKSMYDFKVVEDKLILINANIPVVDPPAQTLEK